MAVDEDKELLRMFDKFLSSSRIRKIKKEDLPSRLFFEVTSMTQNNISKLFNETAIMIKQDISKELLKRGYAQEVASSGLNKHSLTLKGLAECIRLKYYKSYEEQFLDYLDSATEKFCFDESKPLRLDEKIGTLSLILMLCTSEVSSIKMDNDENQELLKGVFNEVISCLKSFNQIAEDSDWKKNVSRGEAEAPALISRINDLPRKTNHYYNIAKKTTGYVSIEKNEVIDKDALFYLLEKVFEFYDPGCDYYALSNKLSDISQNYYIKFLGRSSNPLLAIDLINQIREFLTIRILKLPQKPEILK